MTTILIGTFEAIYETAVLPRIESHAIVALAVILGTTAVYSIVAYRAIYAFFVAPFLSLGDNRSTHR